MGNLFCCVKINQSTVAVRERFGKYDDILEPGCHCVPWVTGSKLAGLVSLRLQQLDVRCETKTKVCFIIVHNFFLKKFLYLSVQNNILLMPCFASTW